MIELLQFFFLPLLGVLSAALICVFYRETLAKSGKNALELVTFDIRRADDKIYNETFLGKYFSKLQEYAGRSRKDLLILDYLAHHRGFNAIESKELTRSYAQYFRLIEKQVMKKNLSYTRIMQLPLGEPGDLPRQELVNKCVELMFLETLEHVKRLLESDCNFRLYILGAPLRPYSYVIVDSTYLLSEYDRYNKAGLSLPDHIIVNKADSGNFEHDRSVRHLIDHHMSQIDAILARKDLEPITLEELRNAFLAREADEIYRASSSGVNRLVASNINKMRKGYEKKQNLMVGSSRG